MPLPPTLYPNPTNSVCRSRTSLPVISGERYFSSRSPSVLLSRSTSFSVPSVIQRMAMKYRLRLLARLRQ